MTLARLRAAGTAIHSFRVQILFACVLACALLMMSMFIDTLRLSVQRGESLREEQRLHGAPQAVRVRPSAATPLQSDAESASR